MLIMPETGKNFQGYAERIASDFIDNGASLTDGVVKVALEEQLTPEEIKRLVEKSNTLASVSFLASSFDKKASFKLAELDDVLKRTHPTDDDAADGEAADAAADDASNSEGVEKTASTCRASITERKYKRAHEACDSAFAKYVGQVKVAEDCTKAKQAKSSLASYFTAISYRDAIMQEKLAAEASARDGIDWLISEFSKYKSPDFGKFASEGVAIYGEKAMPIVNAVAGYIREPVKITKVAYIIDDDDPCLKKLGQVCDSLSNILVLGEGVRVLDQAAAQFRDAAYSHA